MSEREKLLIELERKNSELGRLDIKIVEAWSDLRSFMKQRHFYHADVFENEVQFYKRQVRTLQAEKKAANRELLNIQRALSEVNQQTKRDWNKRFVEVAYEYLSKEQFSEIKRLVGDGVS